MRLFKYVVLFVAAFLTAAVVIFTFQQNAFEQTAPIRLGGYLGPSLPVYVYVAAAFFTGLLIGVVIAVYNFISGNLRTRKLRRDLRNSEQTIDDLRTELEECRKALQQQEAMHEGTPQAHDVDTRERVRERERIPAAAQQQGAQERPSGSRHGGEADGEDDDTSPEDAMPEHTEQSDDGSAEDDDNYSNTRLGDASRRSGAHPEENDEPRQ
jgi:hypothetical protein